MVRGELQTGAWQQETLIPLAADDEFNTIINIFEN